MSQGNGTEEKRTSEDNDERLEHLDNASKEQERWAYDSCYTHRRKAHSHNAVSIRNLQLRRSMGVCTRNMR
ncbi:hypothetical protein IV203_027897 [Nitzschia inconspicua]|uniref:Uncharacterized protein n=1 Tax=Nitzschia inconspicua TaxID=303405 RepID=A0A9K3Q496_9STRA|nr:hypothetical protein IV203_027897 [Nitzschia inconspicua]